MKAGSSPTPSSRKRKADDALGITLPVRIAIKGKDMSYTYLAAGKFFQNCSVPTEIVSSASVQDVFDKVIREECAYGLMPLESSSFGTIHTVYDRLLASNGQLQIIGEMGQIEQHCLCIKANVDARELDVQRVVSHPHILECCSEYLKSLDARRQSLQRASVERVAAWDSAAGCETIASVEDDGVIKAAICSKEAAEKNGLKVLVDAIGNDRNAETRYIVIAKCVDATPGSSFLSGSLVDPLCIAEPMNSSSRSNGGHKFVPPLISSKAGRKSSIALALRNIPGAIFKMSSCFAFRNIDITKIESRPATVAMQLNFASPEERPFTQRHWDLIFYIDFEPSDQEDVNEALFRNLQEYCVWYRVLGSYRSGLNNVAIQPAEWTTLVDTLSC